MEADNNGDNKVYEPINWKSSLAAYMFVISLTIAFKIAEVQKLLSNRVGVAEEVLFLLTVSILLSIVAYITLSLCRVNALRIIVLILFWLGSLFCFLLLSTQVQVQKETNRLNLLESIVWQNRDFEGFYIIYFKKDTNNWDAYNEPGEKGVGYRELSKCNVALEAAKTKSNQYTTSDWQCVAK